MTRFVLFLFVSFSICACGMKLQSRETSGSSEAPAGVTGMTPAETLVEGNSVAAKITIAPSSQVVRGVSVGAKISVQ